ncbi:MAG: ATP-binding protein, partial [Jatrophihabitantaceae bacterium]
LLCVAMELDPDTEARCARAHHDASLTAPTFSLALRLLPEPSWDALSAQSPLRYWRLIEVQPSSGRPLTLSPLRADERIVNYIKGLNRIDEWLVHLLRPVTVLPAKELPPSQQDTVARVLAVWDEPTSDALPPLVELIGNDRRTCRSLAAAAAARGMLNLYEADPAQLPTAAGELAEVLRRLDRESMLQPMACYLDLAELAPGTEAAAIRLATDCQATIIIGAGEPWPLSRRRTRLIDARRPTNAEQEQLWIELLGTEQRGLAARLADHYDLDPATIADCVEQATPLSTGQPAGDAGGAVADPELIWTVCRDQIRPRLAALAQCIDPVAGWSDLVLPAEEQQCLHQLADQVRGRPIVMRDWGLQRHDSRGRGITALFCGQPGTGKTLAAEVVAGELELTLYRVDLSGVVSKYIGETERNLRQVFDAAEEGGALLFFDEADALFGKRSEVKDAHDRYANIEVNYLLQRMEDYRGIAILATNQRNAIDPAFLRRLRFVITFPFPSRPERRALWQRA